MLACGESKILTSANILMFRSDILKFISLLALIAVVAVSSCLAVFYLFLRPQLQHGVAHESFIQQLGLEGDLAAEIEKIEQEFETQRNALLYEFEIATKELADLLKTENDYSERVQKSITEIHRIHGELQSLSIQRYFVILGELPTDKQKVLRQLAAAGLSHPE